MKVNILGAATSKFGELWHISPRTLVTQVVKEAVAEAGIANSQIEAIFVGNMLSGILSGQEHLGAFFAEELGFKVAAVKVEGACASGGLAMHVGTMAVSSGLYEKVLVIGVEKMTDFKPEEVATALMGAGSDFERDAGATFPGLYALIARAHMEKFGTKATDLALVSVKNHYHASLNSHAHFVKPITVDDVLKGPIIASPLRLLDCSPISDGAAAVVLSGKRKAVSGKRLEVNIIASAVATDTLGLAEREELTSLAAAVTAAKKAYQIAGVSPKDIDVAEVHDCFTIAEIIAMEDLGFFVPGQAVAAIRNGQTQLGSSLRPIVNTSGGLKASGHPVGATGVKQIVEVYKQLKGTAGKKQVANAQIGLTHNVGGSGATAVIHILKSL